MALKQKIKARLNKHFGSLLFKFIEADNRYVYKGYSLQVPAGVFHPRYFTSSKMLVSFVESQDLKGKHILELGCGSAITSIAAHLGGATVTSTDISETVVENLKLNQEKYGFDFRVIKSDLFDSIPMDQFDLVLINPPYYPKKVTEEKEHAWYCGENFEYFDKLFKQLNERKITQGVYLTLSSDCDFEEISNRASQYAYGLQEVWSKSNPSEKNILYEAKQTA